MKILIEIFPFKKKKNLIKYLFLKKLINFKKISIVFKNNINSNYFFLYFLKLNIKIILHYNLNNNIFIILKENYIFKNNFLLRFLLLKGDFNKVNNFNFFKFYKIIINKKFYFSFYPEYYRNIFKYKTSSYHNYRRSFIFKNKRIISQHINFYFSLKIYKINLKNNYMISGFFIFKNLKEIFNSFNNCNIYFPNWYKRYILGEKENTSNNSIFYIYHGIKNIIKSNVKKISFFTLNNFYHLKDYINKIFK
ncbi:hypothetical protein ACWNYI_00290 [Candidatus Vidania fulgoroideorum]